MHYHSHLHLIKMACVFCVLLEDGKKNLSKMRRVEPRTKDEFEVPNVPVEWMSMFHFALDRTDSTYKTCI